MTRFKVLEFGSYLAAPLTGKYLADAGFDVTCVRKPIASESARAEEEYMSRCLRDLRRGKRVVTLDLNTEASTAEALIRETDVLVENLRPGTLAKFGFGYEACRSINSEIIYVSMPGYVHSDEEFAGVEAWDSIIMASSGVLHDMGLNRTLLGVRASFSSLHLPSTYASIFAAFAIVSAVYDERRGVHLEVPLASCLLESLVHNSIEFPLDNSYKNLRMLQIEAGDYPIDEAKLESLVDPFFAKYMCSDGRPIYIVCPNHSRHQESLLRAVGVYDEVLKHVKRDVNLYCDRSTEHGIGAVRLTQEQADAVRPILKAAFLSRPARAWECLLGGADIPCIMHKSAAEWRSCAHAAESRLFADGRIGPLHWHSTLGYSDPTPGETFKDLRVLDMSNVIAGPTIGAMLARMGAEVIKIDPVSPFYGPGVTVLYGIVANIGKQSLLLNVSRPDGREFLNTLIRDSDVIIINSTPRSLERIGMTHAELRKINPRILLTRFDAWGGPTEAGEYANFVGYDDNIQAGIGIMERFGGGLETCEEHAHIGTIDVIAGVAGAFATVTSLLLRKHSGAIATARTSLAAVGQYLQYLHMFDEQPQLGKGLSCRGAHEAHRYCQTRDGYVMIVACMSNDRERLRRCCAALPGAATLLSKSSKEVVAEMRALNVAATEFRSLTELKRVYTVATVNAKLTYQFVELCGHPVGRLVMVPPLAVRWNFQVQALRESPKYGSDTARLLSAYNRSRLLLTGTASVAYSRNYIPFTMTCDKCGVSHATVQLNCKHKFCYGCIAANKNSRCFSCGQVHDMNIRQIRLRVATWLSDYNNWRRGGVKGSRDLHRLIRPRALRRAHSFPLNARFQSISLTSSGSFSTIKSSGLKA